MYASETWEISNYFISLNFVGKADIELTSSTVSGIGTLYSFINIFI